MQVEDLVKTDGSCNFPDVSRIQPGEDGVELIDDYLEATRGLIDELELSALAYEKGQDIENNADTIRRILHKLKGESGVMGFEAVTDVIHTVEQAFDELQDQIKADLILKTKDWIETVLEHISGSADAGVQTNTDQPQTAEHTGQPPADSAAISHIPIENFMTTGVITVSPETNIFEAVEIMVNKNITGLPVVEKDLSLVGIISEKDVLKLLYDMEVTNSTVGDFMTTAVVGFDRKTTAAEVNECFLANNFRRITVLENGRLVGVVSRRDLIKLYRKALENSEPGGTRRTKKIFIADDIMTKGLITLQTEDSIYDVIKILTEHNLTGIPVVNEDMTLAGVISEKDALKLSFNLEKTDARVCEYMTSDPVTFRPGASLIDICDTLINNHFRRVIITNSKKIPVGIVSRKDIIALILKHRNETKKA